MIAFLMMEDEKKKNENVFTNKVYMEEMKSVLGFKESSAHC